MERLERDFSSKERPILPWQDQGLLFQSTCLGNHSSCAGPSRLKTAVLDLNSLSIVHPADE